MIYCTCVSALKVLNPAQIVVCVVNVSMNAMMLTVELGPDDSSCSYYQAKLFRRQTRAPSTSRATVFL